MTVSVQALREQRSVKAKDARKILDDHSGDKWNDDAKTKVDAIYAEIDRLDEQLERFDRALKIEDNLEQRAKPLADQSGKSVDEEANKLKIEKGIFNAWARGGDKALNDDQVAFIRAKRDEMQRIYGAQSVETASAGGYLAPRDFSTNLLERMKAFGGMREVATILQTDGGNPIDWVTSDETAEEGEIVAENQPASDGDMAFGTVNIGAHKYSSKVVTVPFELLQDSRIDIEPLVNGKLALRLSRVTNRHFTVGSGVNQPRGAVVAAASGKVGAAGQTGSVTYDDLVDLEHSVDPAYRGAARLMFHDQTLKTLKKLKDAEGRPLWRPGITGGDPNDVLGYGYTINQHMPTMAASAKSILFGDFSKYLIRDVMAVSLFRFSDSVYTRKGQVGFMAWMRADGDLIDASNDALRYYQNAAA